MSSWLKLLPLEIQEVETLMNPTEEVGSNETIVGTISDDLKKLWTLCRGLKQSAEIMQVESRYKNYSPDEVARYNEYTAKANALQLIFWIGVNDELDLWGSTRSCGVRKGWQVVEFEQPLPPSPFKFMIG